MEKLHKIGQITKTLLVSALLILIPFISSSMRTSYLYFLLNILILLLACESGILQLGPLPDSNSPDHDKKRVAAVTASNPSYSQPHGQRSPTANVRTTNISCVSDAGSFLLNNHPLLLPAENPTAVLIDKAAVVSDTKNPTAAIQGKKHKSLMQSCPSVPSLFFVGTFDDGYHEGVPEEEHFYDPQEDHLVEEEEEEEEIASSVPMMEADDMLSKQELFYRAEMLIGNFYRQLQMQREESWKKLHGLYQKP